MSKVVKIETEVLTFDDGSTISSYHESDCCESHYLSFENLTMDDFKDLDFDLSNKETFEKIEGYGITLKPIKGFPIRVPGYGYNNGYYGTDLQLIVSGPYAYHLDITECQVIEG